MSSDIEIRMPADEKEGTEASVAKWLKKVGEPVKENEPLVEIATDKVTVEIAAPAAGALSETIKQEGDAVQPGDLLGRIRVGADEAQAASRSVIPSGAKDLPSSPDDKKSSPVTNIEEGLSPAVRRLLRDHNLDAAQVPVAGNRLTIADVEQYIANPASQKRDMGHSVAFTGRRVPHTPMRKAIAAHMLRSVQTAPHVTSVFEADLSHVLADREARKSQGSEDVPSVTAYLIQAALAAMREVPEVNSKWHDDALEVFDEINFGFGAATEGGGLVVPVIRSAEKLSLEQISKHLRELTAKARAGKLTQADMEGGTFTISNHGVSGSLLAAPIIIPGGQAAILGAGKLQKRVVVGESDGGKDMFKVRPIMYVTLTVDHRSLDAQQTNAWLTAFVAALQAD